MFGDEFVPFFNKGYELAQFLRKFESFIVLREEKVKNVIEGVPLV